MFEVKVNNEMICQSRSQSVALVAYAQALESHLTSTAEKTVIEFIGHEEKKFMRVTYETGSLIEEPKNV